MFRAIWHKSNWADRAAALVLASAFGLFVATWASMSDLSALDLKSRAHETAPANRHRHAGRNVDLLQSGQHPEVLAEFHKAAPGPECSSRFVPPTTDDLRDQAIFDHAL